MRIITVYDKNYLDAMSIQELVDIYHSFHPSNGIEELEIGLYDYEQSLKEYFPERPGRARDFTNGLVNHSDDSVRLAGIGLVGDFLFASEKNRDWAIQVWKMAAWQDDALVIELLREQIAEALEVEGLSALQIDQLNALDKELGNRYAYFDKQAARREDRK